MLRNFLNTLFVPPVFADEDKTRAGRLLNIVLWFMFATPFVYGVISISQDPQRAGRFLLQSGSVMLVSSSMLWWMRRGHVRFASVVLVSALGLMFTLSAWTGGGAHGNAYLAFILVIVLATALLGGWVGILVLVICAALGMFFVYMEGQGGLPISIVKSSPISDWAETIIYFSIVVLLQIFAQSMVKQSLAKSQQQVQERTKAEAHLQDSLKEKEVLLKEIHHRVKNNMQVIVSILNLQASYVGDAKTQGVLHDAQNRVRSMALVHEQLYKSKNLAHIDFRDYLQHLASTLFNSYSPETSHVHLTFDIGEIALGVDTAVPCGLIASELISNALKHAFPNNQAGEIVISLQPTANGLLELSVQDNGVGIPEEKDWRQTESLGMQLVQSLVKQINGTIEMTRLVPGTRFAIQFKPGV